MNNYEQYIKGKKVVFCGPCPNIKNLKKGELIDSYDVVIRPNNFLEIIENYKLDYGSRCDVAYINKAFLEHKNILPVIELCQKCNCSWLCCKSFGKIDCSIKSNIDIRKIDRHPVWKHVGIPYLGLMAICDILHFEPDELYFTGVDFFASRKNRSNSGEYLAGYYPKWNIGPGDHHFLNNAKYALSLFSKHKNLKTDDFILDLLNKIATKKIKKGDICYQ